VSHGGVSFAVSEVGEVANKMTHGNGCVTDAVLYPVTGTTSYSVDKLARAADWQRRRQRRH